MNWKDVPGWCDFEDVYAEAVKVTRSGGHMVELGAAFGKSAALMASLIKESGKDLRFDAVDMWWKIKNWKERWPPRDNRHKILHVMDGDIHKAFLHYMKETGSSSYVRNVRASFVDAVSAYEGKSLDFVFLDGDHTYDGTVKYLNSILPKMKPGGVLAGHDYDSVDWPGVVRAVDERFPDRRIIGRCFWQQLS